MQSDVLPSSTITVSLNARFFWTGEGQRDTYTTCVFFSFWLFQSVLDSVVEHQTATEDGDGICNRNTLEHEAITFILGVIPTATKQF